MKVLLEFELPLHNQQKKIEIHIFFIHINISEKSVMLQICHDPTHQKGSFMVDHTTKG
jgi:hypothetical protein